MDFVRRRPRPELADHVAYLWSLRDAPGHAREKITPCGSLELVVNLVDDEVHIYDEDGGLRHRLSGTVVSGAYRRFFVIDTRVHTSMVGVHFRPGGAAGFLGVPPGELADHHVDLEALWGPAAMHLRETLRGAATDESRFAALEDALLSRLAQARRRHPAIPVALAQLARPGITVGDVAAQVDLSRRRLIEVFTAEVGMGPKRLSRVLRFQRAAVLARRCASPDWGRLAATCGYYDQSHLIRDVDEFTGVSPTSLRAAGERVKDLHLAIADRVKHFQYAGRGDR